MYSLFTTHGSCRQSPRGQSIDDPRCLVKRQLEGRQEGLVAVYAGGWGGTGSVVRRDRTGKLRQSVA